MTWPLGMRRRAPTAASRDAFDTIILPYLDSAHNLARWLVRDTSLAEDVVQDSVVRALLYIATYEGGDARAWLMRIVRNVAYDALAARKRQQAPRIAISDGDATLIERVADPGDDPETALSRRQDQAALTAALAELPLDLRECLVLRELENLSYKEIAHVIDVPLGTVMSRLWRARRTLLEITAKGSTS